MPPGLKGARDMLFAVNCLSEVLKNSNVKNISVCKIKYYPKPHPNALKSTLELI
jgi:hypothetical protein